MKNIIIVFILFLFMASFAGAENMITKIDLIDIQKLDPTIIVDLKYASVDNLFERPVYPENKAYFRAQTAEKLARVQKNLQKEGLGLKIWDAYRPLAVQKHMWELMPNPKFVANPKTGSNHNRGCAVDATLVDKNGNELPMPTKFDDFSDRAKADYKKLPKDVIKNRDTLKAAFLQEGFTQYENEWWHFADKDYKNFGVLNISFDKLAKENAQKKEEPLPGVLQALEKKKIIFNLSDIKNGLDFLDSAPTRKVEANVLAFDGIFLENKTQEFSLKVNSASAVLFNGANYEAVLSHEVAGPAKDTSQFSFFINNEPAMPKGKVFNLTGKVTVKTDYFILKARGINWQEDENTITIKVFRWK